MMLKHAFAALDTLTHMTLLGFSISEEKETGQLAVHWMDEDPEEGQVVATVEEAQSYVLKEMAEKFAAFLPTIMEEDDDDEFEEKDEEEYVAEGPTPDHFMACVSILAVLAHYSEHHDGPAYPFPSLVDHVNMDKSLKAFLPLKQCAISGRVSGYDLREFLQAELEETGLAEWVRAGSIYFGYAITEDGEAFLAKARAWLAPEVV